MFVYQKFLIRETDRFDPSTFPQLEESLQQTLAELETGPAGPSAAMILSYVKDHSINSQQAKDHPQLATLISSRSLPLGIMEQLFESGRQNPIFQREMEGYIKSYLTVGKS